jgi:hypothetical protein
MAIAIENGANIHCALSVLFLYFPKYNAKSSVYQGGWTPALKAAVNGHLNCLQFLFGAGVNLSTPNAVTNY